MQENKELITEFLRESNAIERVYDDDSLAQAERAWGFLNKQAENGINPFIIMQVHELLMENVGAWSEPELLPKYRGVFRDCPVYIGGKEAIKSNLIKKEIESWCSKMNYMPLKGNVSQFAKELHIEYERIHPFVDGNGRTGRMFMNWYLIRNNMPIVIIHEGNEQMEYYSWFRNNENI